MKYLLIAWAVGCLLAVGTYATSDPILERTQTRTISVSAEVRNSYDPVSTPEEPQQSATITEVYQPVIVESQEDLLCETGTYLIGDGICKAEPTGCPYGDSLPLEKCEAQ